MADAALLAVQRVDELPQVADTDALPDAVAVSAKDGEMPAVPLEPPETETLGDVELERRVEAVRDGDAEMEGLGLVLRETAAGVALLTGVVETAILAVESTLLDGGTLALGMRDGVIPSDTVTTALALECILTDTDDVVDGDVLALPLREVESVVEGEPEDDFDGRRESDSAAVSEARLEYDDESDVDGEAVFESVARADAELTDGLDERVAVTETDVLEDTDGLIEALREIVGENDTDEVGDGRVEADGRVDVDGEPDVERDGKGDLVVSADRVTISVFEDEPVDDTVALPERDAKYVGESRADAEDVVDPVEDSDGLVVTVPLEVDGIVTDSAALADAETEERGESELFDVLLRIADGDAVKDAEPHTDDVGDDDGDCDGELDVWKEAELAADRVTFRETLASAEVEPVRDELALSDDEIFGDCVDVMVDVEALEADGLPLGDRLPANRSEAETVTVTVGDGVALGDIDADGDRRFDADDVGDGERPGEKLSLTLPDDDCVSLAVLDTDTDARTDDDRMADLDGVRDTKELVESDGELETEYEYCGDFELTTVEDATEFEDVGDDDTDD